MRRKRTPRERGAAPTRSSARLRGERVDGSRVDDDGGDGDGDGEEEEDEDEDEIMAGKIARLQALHAARQTEYKTPKDVSYAHTWMRVRTMDEKGLSRRVRVIENAKGQFCVEKMRMFAEVLALAGMDDIAKEAEEALDRLLAIVRKVQ